MKQMNWNQLFYFCEIAREGSLKLAAQKLEVTSSTLSEHLAQLEKDLKTELFYRQPRKLMLTDDGKHLYHKVKPLFETGLRFMDFVSPDPLGNYPVTVGIVPGSSRIIGFSLLSKYASSYGTTNMNFSHASQEDLERELFESRFDFGFSNFRAKKNGLSSCPISISPVKLYVSPKWGNTLLPKLIKRLPILNWKAAAGIQSSLSIFLKDRELSPQSTITGEDVSTLHQFCEAGMGIGVFSEDFVQCFGNKLVPIKNLKNDVIRIEKVFVIWLQEAKKTKAIQHLLNLLSEKGFLKSSSYDRKRKLQIVSK